MARKGKRKRNDVNPEPPNPGVEAGKKQEEGIRKIPAKTRGPTTGAASERVRQHEPPAHSSSIAASGVDESTTCSSTMSLEEQIRIQEGMLQSLIDRQSQIVQQLERARTQRAALTQRKEDLQNRQTQLSLNRIKHFTLQKEIHESLTKSRERLGRLESLEKEEEEQNKDTDMQENPAVVADLSFGDDDDIDKDDDQQPAHSIEEQGKNDDEQRHQGLNKSITATIPSCSEYQSPSEKNNPGPQSDTAETTNLSHEESKITIETAPCQSFDELLPPRHIMDFVVEFNRNHTMKSSTALWTFLPLIKPDQMKTIMTFSCHEANARFDVRRQLLWNTCLDFSLLSKRIGNNNTPSEEGKTSTLNHKKSKSNDDDYDFTDANKEGYPGITMDPNVSMCPYELAGVCDDEFCPYQHTTKERLMIPREHLPLPPLNLRLVDDDGDKEKKKRTNEDLKRAKKKPGVANVESPSTLTVEEPATAETDERRTQTSEEASDMETEQDFIKLPPPRADDWLEEDDGDDSSDDDFVSAYYKSVRWSFWWGGTLEDHESSMEDTLIKWANLHYDYGDSSPTDITDIIWLGRMIDVCRITIHMGRIDVASYVSAKVLERILQHKQSEERQHSGMMPIAAQLSKLHKTLLFGGSGENSVSHTTESSFYRSSFVLQTCLAILSETARAVHETENEEDVELILESTHHCINAITTKQETGQENDEYMMPDVKEVVNLIISNYSGNTKSSLSSTSISVSLVRRFQDLENGVRWAETAFRAESPILASLHNIEDRILKPCWSLCTDWIRANRHEKEAGRDQIFKGLLATTVIGFAVLGLLERFAAHLPIGKDKLNASTTAALIEVDSTINRLLNRLLDELADLPLFNLLISPLSAATVSTASFLRMYSNSQHRLEGALQLNRNRTSRGATSALMGSLSGLLWSQLLQLRMTLPTMGTPPSSGEYDWEVSQEDRESNRLLLERMRKLGVRANHIALPGDSLLCQAMGNDQPGLGRRMKQKTAKNIKSLATTLLKINYEGDEGSEDSSILARNINMECREDAHGRISSGTISTLPRSLLVAGMHIQTLCLDNCGLSALPISFGLYFPNLLILGLSQNFLRELPSSFKALAKLQEFRCCHNQLEELGDIAGRDLKRFTVRNNKISVLSLPTTKWTQLEELNLSSNCLKIPATELALWTVQLKNLRRLDYHPQKPAADNPPGQESADMK